MANFAKSIFKALKGLHEEDGGIKTAIHNFGKGMTSAGPEADWTQRLATGGASAGAGFIKNRLEKPDNPIAGNIAVDAPMDFEDDEAMRRRKAIMSGMMTMNQGVG